ncbi:MAG: TetR/AcrR family transcriptional regulator [Candidatus Phaeomarinobacter sp.]
MTPKKAPKTEASSQESAPQNSKEAKARILAAASDLFLEGGVKSLSVRAIAAKAGISTIGIYSHFQGKQGILDALYIEGFELVIESMTVADRSLSALDTIMQASKQYLDMAEAHAAHYRLIFGERDASFVPSLEAEMVGATAFTTMARHVAALLPDTASRREKQDAAVQTWAVLHGYVSLRQHDVSRLVDMSDWKAQALRSLGVLVEAMHQTANP